MAAEFGWIIRDPETGLYFFTLTFTRLDAIDRFRETYHKHPWKYYHRNWVIPEPTQAARLLLVWPLT